MNAVEYIRSKMDIHMAERVLNYYRASKIHHFGSALRCCCPLHEGDNPTSFVWKDNGLFFCHTQCGRGGDIFSFVAEMEHLDLDKDFRKVVSKVSSILSINITGLELGERKAKQEREFEEWVRYAKKKKAHNQTVEYNLGRLGDLTSVESYRGISKETLELFEVQNSVDLDRKVFPIRDTLGKIVGVTCRTNKDGVNPKWLHLPEGLKTGDIFYGMHLVSTKEATIVEGANDVLSLRDKGVESIGAFGARLTDEQVKLLCKNYETVNLMYDGDKAGINATKSALDKLKGKMTVYVKMCPFSKDPGDLSIEELRDIKTMKPYEFEEFYAKWKESISV